MQVIGPDFARRIDLPGAGPCPRPVDIDQAVTGFKELVSLRIYSFVRGLAIDGEAEGDELLIIPMRGEIELTVTAVGRTLGRFVLGDDWETRAIYMPPGSSYRLGARRDADVAYARVRGGTNSARQSVSFEFLDGRVTGKSAGMTFCLTSLAPGTAFPVGKASVAPERLIHIRTAAEGRATVGGASLSDWETVALERGEAATLVGEGAPVKVLIVSAR